MADDGFSEQNLANSLIDYLIESRDSDSRRKFLSNADKFWRFYRQEEWWEPSDDGDAYEAIRPVSLENRIFEKIETLVSVFFKHLPKVESRPLKPSDYDLTRENNKHIEYAMREASYLQKMREGSRECFITGMNIYHTGWNAAKVDVYGNGDCDVSNMDREDIYLDPLPGLTDIQKSRFLGLLFWLPINVVLERMGEPAAKALGVDKKRGTPVTRTRSLSEAKVRDTLALNVNSEEEYMELFDPQGDLVPVYEVWYRTTDFREEQLADKQRRFTRESALGKVAYLINGRIVKQPKRHPFRTYKRKPNIIDGESIGERSVPIGHGQFPVVRQTCYQVQSSSRRKGLYDVMGIVEQLESLQWDVNDLARQMMINARTIANPVTIVNGDDLVSPNDPQNLVLFPAMKIVTKGNKPINETIQIQQPPSIPAYAQYLHERKHQNIDTISGIKGFVAGNIHKGTSHTTAEGTNLVSEADFSMMWTLIHNTEDAMKQIIRQFWGLQQQFYKVGRYTNISLNGQEIFTEWSTRNAVAEFSYDVVSGSATPQQDIQRIQHVTFAMQAIQPVLQAPTPDNIRLALFTLEAANLPWTHEFTAWLQNKLEQAEEQERIQEQTQLLLEAATASGLNLGGLTQQPDGIGLLANELGIAPNDIISALSVAG